MLIYMFLLFDLMIEACKVTVINIFEFIQILSIMDFGVIYCFISVGYILYVVVFKLEP